MALAFAFGQGREDQSQPPHGLHLYNIFRHAEPPRDLPLRKAMDATQFEYLSASFRQILNQPLYATQLPLTRDNSLG